MQLTSSYIICSSAGKQILAKIKLCYLQNLVFSCKRVANNEKKLENREFPLTCMRIGEASV